MERSSIRIILADDHQMVRKGLSTMIQGFDDLELVGEAANGSEVIQLCAEAQPDVVLMDLVMPEMDGITATRTICENHPQIKVIALTSFKDGELVQAALQAGAISYILKDVSVDELVAAIRAAHAGKPTLTWEAMQALISVSMRPPQPNYGLTERELAVLSFIVDGLTNRQIAEQLNISRYTVNAHVSHILAKLNVRSRTEAVSVALQNNLVTKP